MYPCSSATLALALTLVACGAPATERGAGQAAGSPAGAGVGTTVDAATVPHVATPPDAGVADAAPPPSLTFQTATVEAANHLRVEPGGLDLGPVAGAHRIAGSVDLCGSVPQREARRGELVQVRASGKAPVTIVEFDRPGHQRAVVFVTREAAPRVVLELSLPKVKPGADHRAEWDLVRAQAPGEPLAAVVTLTSFSCTGTGENRHCKRPFRKHQTRSPSGIDCR
jgi:hypothetical protein